MAAFGQTIAIVDRSGKVVSTSKHLVNVFKEAKSAYRERKAEVVAGRQSNLEEKKVRRALKGYTIDDGRSSYSPRSPTKSKHTSRKPVPERHHSGHSPKSETSTIYPSSHHRFEQDIHVTSSQPGEMLRRHSARDGDFTPSASPRRSHSARDGDFTPPASPKRSMSSPGPIDMDLAYGDIPPPLPIARVGEEAELKGLVGKVKMMLEEADCLQYSATAIIANLQKNPDAMAAVALTLAEISNIVSKMAPGVLMAMKGSSPAVFALLASPQFLIAAGVGVGITVVCLGGYKIIKKIKAKHAEEDPGMDEMLEIGGDVSRIDSWRRGIAEVEGQSIGTSVDGEFITPQAAALSRINLQETATASRRKGVSSSKSSSSKGSKTNSKTTAKPKKEVKVKKPSPLRLMFK